MTHLTAQKIKAAFPDLHWLRVSEDSILELVLDHHTMATFRNCEERFKLEFIEGYGGSGRIWFLDFGICFHTCIEHYYLNFRKSGEGRLALAEWLEYARFEWNAMEMEYYAQNDEYLKLGGLQGFLVLLAQYYGRFSAENERLRVVGAELYFGKNKEVPIIAEPSQQYPFRMYLSGKIDLLVDDGVDICPVDHKTSKDFRGKDPTSGYEVQEGMTGYVYAARHLVKTLLPDANRTTKKIYMNFVQVKPESDVVKRFKRTSLYKTDYQLEQYRLRQARTGQNILSLLVNLVHGGVAQWNTTACSSWFHRDCTFKQVHRQNSEDNIFNILGSDFIKKPIWNPEERVK